MTKEATTKAKTAQPAKAAKTKNPSKIAVSAQDGSEVKTLGNLSPAAGSNITNKRKGRGIGSGLGKTAGRGHKGQRARKSGNAPRGFEGGQMPLYRRLPKRGFTSRNRIEYNEINLDRLLKFDGKTKITIEFLAQQGLLRNGNWPVKLLGRGTLEKALTIAVNKATKGATAAVEKAGGKVEIIA